MYVSGISKKVQAHLAKWNGVQFNSPTVQFSSVQFTVNPCKINIMFCPLPSFFRNSIKFN